MVSDSIYARQTYRKALCLQLWVVLRSLPSLSESEIVIKTFKNANITDQLRYESAFSPVHSASSKSVSNKVFCIGFPVQGFASGGKVKIPSHRSPFL